MPLIVIDIQFKFRQCFVKFTTTTTTTTVYAPWTLSGTTQVTDEPVPER